ncbi:MAG: hypothetical protein LBF91_03115 [Azoarcus sp.]|jgi:hypothetical protein|nr:hypothetical protein [Azoarcus sp.]
MSPKKAGRFIAQLAFWIAWLLGMAMPYNARHDMLVDTGVYVPDSIPGEPGDTALVSMVLFIAAITLQSLFLLTHKTPPEKKKSIFLIVFAIVTFGIKYVSWWLRYF